MAYTQKNNPFRKKPKRSKKVKEIEYQVDANVFASEPYSATSYRRESLDPYTTSKARTIGAGSWQQGSGYVEGLESKLTQNPDGSYTRTQVESSPAYLKRKSKKRKKKKSKEPRKTTKGKGRNFRTTKEGAGMTEKGVREYRRKNPGSKLKTAVTGKVKRGSKAAKRRKSFCARSRGWTSERGKAARRRWKC